jgi:hypothetical protein
LAGSRIQFQIRRSVASLVLLVLGATMAQASIATAAGSRSSDAPVPCGPAWATNFVGDLGDSLDKVTALSKSDAWAVGSRLGATLTEHWNGSQWSEVPSPNVGSGHSFLFDVKAVGATDVWAVGGFEGPLQEWQTLVIHWDGVEWSVVPSPNVNLEQNDLRSIDVVGPNDVWAVGIYRDETTRVYRPLTEHWDGTEWSIVATPQVSPNGETFTGVTADPSGQVLASGYYSTPSGHDRGLVERYSGGQWHVVPSVQLSHGPSLSDIESFGPADAWAVGSASGTFIEHYDGTGWTSVPPGDTGGSNLNTVAGISAGDIWTGGSTISTGSVALLEHWDGPAWSTVAEAGPTADFVGDIAVFDGGAFSIGTKEIGVEQAVPVIQRVCPVRVGQSGFSPRAGTESPGATTFWHFDTDAAGSHSIADATGLALFDSAPRAGGQSFQFAYPGAGTYQVADSLGAQSRIVVGVVVSPPSGGVGDTYSIDWATKVPPTEYVFDTQIRRPNATGWVSWMRGSSDVGGTFVPDAGAGRYGFRTRLRNPTTGAVSSWPPRSSLVAA